MCSRFSSARMSSRSLASRAPIGSSISSAFGRRTSARPIATRCMSPPESCRRPLCEQPLDPQRRRHRPHLALGLGLRLAGRPQREGDVLEGGQVRIEREQLEHEGDVALARRQILHRLPVDGDVAGVDRLEPGDGAQRRGLAATGGAEQHHELAVGDLEVQLADDVVRAEILLDVAEPDRRHHSSSGSGEGTCEKTMKPGEPDQDDRHPVAVQQQVPGLHQRDDADHHHPLGEGLEPARVSLEHRPTSGSRRRSRRAAGGCAARR